VSEPPHEKPEATGHDNPYDLLATDHDAGQRWALRAPASPTRSKGIDTSAPDGVDGGALGPLLPRTGKTTH